MGDPAKKRATYADLEAVPEHLVAELSAGVGHTFPRPASPQCRAAGRLCMTVGPPFDMGSGGPGGWHIYVEPELHLGEDVLVPDLAGWRRERGPQMPRAPFFTLPPDWVCEFLSRSMVAEDFYRKVSVYEAAGVTWLWYIEPTMQALDVYHLGPQKRWTLQMRIQDVTTVRAPPFDAVALDLTALWEGLADEAPGGG
ncbi:Uma2 family endonuclease [Chondromyces apiculatus]|uniref:Putative restriction endonuclease domain-containing protein n=1 Tax=Chondromyces apiculatus DSM 436 TaxID=1192034 RepID=A0A017SYV5_9BACT|nr:Uma2 family endonuclease [Chondromyces apiculatus]EYF01800.1 Hypothetical protein CAP_7753 [Chondromyces apiculatus DSM 436]